MNKNIEKNNKKNINKRVIIFIVAIILILIAIVVLFKIGKTQKEINYLNKTTSNFKTILKSNKYYLEAYIVDKDFNIGDKKLIICKNNNNIVMETSNLSIIMKGEYIYAVSHTNKTILKATIDNSNIDLGFSKLVNNNITDKGTKKIGDKEYEYENYNGFKIYFYNGKVEYVENEASILKVDKISNEIDENLFKIPSDYTITTKEQLDKDTGTNTQQ